jgi:hypothetical protein
MSGAAETVLEGVIFVFGGEEPHFLYGGNKGAEVLTAVQFRSGPGASALCDKRNSLAGAKR